ncbi:hypothetical protein ACP70R_046786 [Stipagrostis hirtigluma subsp. patula]
MEKATTTNLPVALGQAKRLPVSDPIALEPANRFQAGEAPAPAAIGSSALQPGGPPLPVAPGRARKQPITTLGSGCSRTSIAATWAVLLAVLM